MRSPLAWLLPGLAVGFGAGVAVGDRLGWSPLAWSGLSAAVAVAAFGLRRRPRTGALLACVCALALGGRAIAVRLAQAEADRPRTRFDAAVDARVCSQRVSATWSVVELCGIRAVALGVRAPRPWVPERAVVVESRATPEGAWLARRVASERLRAWLRFEPIRGATNPGERDRQRPAARRGVSARARLLDARVAALVLPASDGPLRVWNALRARLAERVVAAGPGGALLAALALGDRRALDPRDREGFRRLGLAHLLAVSGLHLALVGSIAYGLVRAVLLRRRGLAASRDVRVLAVAAAVALSLGYALLAGWAAPVRRAWWFLLAVLGSSLSRRPGTSLHALAAAFLAIVVPEPASVFDLGAQLSFVATAALLVAARPRRRRPVGHGLEALARRVSSGVRVSATAIAVTAPVLAAHGLPATAAGLVANVVAVPATGALLLPAALLGTGAAAAGPGPCSDGILAGCAALAGWALALCRGLAAGLPGASASAPVGPAAWGIAAGLAGGGLVLRSTTARVCVCVAVCVFLGLAPRAAPGPPPPRIVMFDVGQGDAVLLQGRSASVLVDAGSAWADVDQGRRLVLPGLRALGVERLDVVVASHADADHRGGLPAVLESLEVGEVWLPPGFDPGFSALRRLAARRGIPVRERVAGGPRWRRGDLSLEVIWPEPGAAAAGVRGSARNHRSLVLRAELAGSTVLLTGDIDAAAEASLLAAPGRLAADILKVAHHGSRSSSGRSFLRAVGFDLALLSAPCRPDAPLPAPETLDRLRAAGGSVWWTGRDGAIWVALGAHGPEVAHGWNDRVRIPTQVWGLGDRQPTAGDCGTVAPAAPTNVVGRGVP